MNTRGTLRQRTFLGASVDSVHRSVLRTGIWAPPFVQRRVIYCNHTADPSAFDETSAATVTRSCQDDEGDDVWRSIGDATGASWAQRATYWARATGRRRVRSSARHGGFALTLPGAGRVPGCRAPARTAKARRKLVQSTPRRIRVTTVTSPGVARSPPEWRFPSVVSAQHHSSVNPVCRAPDDSS